MKLLLQAPWAIGRFTSITKLRIFGQFGEMGGRYLGVVLPLDGETVHYVQ